MQLDFNHVLTRITDYEKPIVLNHDVVLTRSEAHQFKKGIEIKRDNVVIDGNGHSIDARGKNRIFNVLSKNVVLKNFTFKNGFSEKFGGAVRVAGECKLINCTFENNRAKKGGNDISNGSELSICHCNFSDAYGSINNLGTIYLLKDEEHEIKPLISNNGEIKRIIPKHDVSFLINGDKDHIKGALIRIGDKSGFSNDEGACVLEGIEEGKHSLEVSAEHYISFNGNIDVSENNVLFDIQLERLIQRHDIKILVKHKGEPVSDAIVSVGGIKGSTDENGECIFDDVEEGEISVKVNSNEYENQKYTITVSDNKTTFPINLGFTHLITPFPASDEDHYIFASYSHDDANRVFPELKRFHDCGLNIWYDEGIESGLGWQGVVESKLKACTLFIAFISANAVESINVRREIFLAINKKIPVVPIYLEKTELQHGLDLQLSPVQAILKYAMTEEFYVERCRRAFVMYGLMDEE